MSRPPHRIAAIDVGTNSIHMIIVEAVRRGYRVIDKEKQMVQLGRDSLEGRPLTEAAIEQGVATLRSMADIAARWKVGDIVAVATSAVREAPNRRRFLNAVDRSANIKVRIISGEEEADYIYRAVRSAVDFHGGTGLVIDIGGGSVEIIVGTSAEVFFTGSEPVGALRMSQKFALENAAAPEALAACRTFVRKALKKHLKRIRLVGFDFSIGTSGTILTLATLAAESPNNADEMTSGLRWLSRRRLSELIAALAPLEATERCRRFGLDAKRASTILGGAIVLEQIMDGLKIKQIRACDAALREGIIEHMLDRTRESGTGQARGSIRRASVMDLAERSGVDLVHARHVARLALRVFDQTHDVHMLRTGERELLEYAALLHEIGMHVSYQGHHKHSYYLISHAGLRGFTGDQVAIIANLARYHRKAVPDSAHPNFAQLSAAQRDVVRKLASILRVADALDRGRQGAVRDIGVDIVDSRLDIYVRPRDAADVEMEAAARKGRYMGKVFRRKVGLQIDAR